MILLYFFIFFTTNSLILLIFAIGVKNLTFYTGNVYTKNSLLSAGLGVMIKPSGVKILTFYTCTRTKGFNMSITIGRFTQNAFDKILDAPEFNIAIHHYLNTNDNKYRAWFYTLNRFSKEYTADSWPQAFVIGCAKMGVAVRDFKKEFERNKK